MINLLRKDSVWYTVVFVLWAGIIAFANHSYSYTATPLQGIDFSPESSAPEAIKNIKQEIASLKTSLLTDKIAKSRATKAGQIASSFERIFLFTHQESVIDSAALFAKQAIAQDSHNATVMLLCARIMTEKNDFPAAKMYYEKAISLDPKSAIAYQSLGLLLFYSQKQPVLAKPYFQKAISLDSKMPAAHYSLGEIAMALNDPATAVSCYESELALFATASDQQKSSLPDMTSAAIFSSMQLSFLYSSTFKNAQKAQERFALYQSLETDPQRKQQVYSEIQRMWNNNKSGTVQ